ncbi:hypothetical protein KKF91_21285 [Myxococcota bacterium]|nr:hypothetical protein [Myxococcota bacterium]MBU1433079.1 hypothetical protein [Myxococcota bacterium]MBU1899229.1 hypothetical protein [Myxococcota bacterium]
MLLTANIEPGMLASITDPNGLTGYGWAEENASDITQYHYYPSGWSNIDAASEMVTFTWASSPGFKDSDDFRDWVEANCNTTGAYYAVCVTKNIPWSSLSSKAAPPSALSTDARPGTREIDPQMLVASEDPDKRDGSAWAESFTGYVREHFFAPSGWRGVNASAETSILEGVANKSTWAFSDFKAYVENKYSSAALASGYYMWSDVTTTSW